ncbi:MAG: hypothetical protein Q4B78_01870, partial [Bacillota bacterium]|nr:hypothetical protein [Bacillota bacterium]
MKGTLKRILIIMLAVVTMMSTGGISTASMVYASDEVSLGTQSSSEQEVKAEAEKEAPKEVTKEVPKETLKEEPKEVEKSSDESTKVDTGSADKQEGLEEKAEESQAPDATEEKAENSTEAIQEEEATENEEDSDEVDMPKQSFSATTSKGISVRASVSNDVFPADTKMKVKDVSDAEAMNIAEKTQDNVKAAIGVDITFYDAKGKEIQPKSGGV